MPQPGSLVATVQFTLNGRRRSTAKYSRNSQRRRNSSGCALFGGHEDARSIVAGTCLRFLGAAASCGYAWLSVSVSQGPDLAAITWSVFVAGTATMALVLLLVMEAELASGRSEPRRISGRFTFVGGLIFPLAVVSALLSHGLMASGGGQAERSSQLQAVLAEAGSETRLLPITNGRR